MNVRFKKVFVFIEHAVCSHSQCGQWPYTSDAAVSPLVTLFEALSGAVV